jgi:predicted metal-binding membrane protein
VAGAILAVALAAWVVTIDRMAGMDAGPGTDLGRIGWFMGVWATMMAAMMLPSAVPAVLLFDGAARPRDGRLTTAFVAGYLTVWVLCGVAAYGLYRLVTLADPAFLAWDREGPIVAGAAVAAAGAYQLTPLKRVCLRHCRSPLHVLLARWRPGRAGAWRMGVEHGGFCVGCCWALMLVLFAVGVMSVFWMAVVAVAVFAEKVLPAGERMSAVLAVALVGLGVWIAAAPASVPHLTQPHQAMPGAMHE